MVFTGLTFWLLNPDSPVPITQIALYFCFIGFFAGISGLGMWAIACIISFVGRHVKDDYRKGTLFD